MALSSSRSETCANPRRPRPQSRIVSSASSTQTCVRVHVALALWRGGVTTMNNLHTYHLAPAVRQSRCGGGLDNTTTVATAQPNTRRELALAASETTLLVTQAEMAWGIHLDVGRPTAYFLILREPISRLVSDFVAYRKLDREKHPLAGLSNLTHFAGRTHNYALRFLGNETCRPRRSTCKSLTQFDESINKNFGGADCHLDYDREERRIFHCAMKKKHRALAGNLAYLKANMDRLFLSVGILERLPEVIVSWRHSARRLDTSAWPIPSCLPNARHHPDQSFSEALRTTAAEIKSIRKINALDLDLYDAVSEKFDAQLQQASSQSEETKRNLALARQGKLPFCHKQKKKIGTSVSS